MRELQFLQRLARAAASTLDARDLVSLVISETTEALGTDVCSVYLLSDDGEHLVLSATNGLRTAAVGRVSLRLGEGVTGWAAAERRPVRVDDVRTEPRFRWLPGVDQARFVSMCSVPVVSGDRLVGVLNVQTDARHRFADAEIELLAAIAAQVAGVLERSRLQHRLEERLEDLRRSEAIHRRFTELTLAGSGLETILDAIAGQTGGSVVLYDEEGERLAAAGGEDLPPRLAAPRADGDPAAIPVRAGPDVLGWLAAAEGDAPPGLRRRALEHGVTVLALELARERAAADAEGRMRGDLVEELLSGPLRRGEAARIAERAARLGYPIRGPVWVLVMEADEPGAAGGAHDARQRRVMRAAADVVERRAGRILVERAGRFVVLAPGDESAEEVDALAWTLLSAAGRATAGGSFSCGVCATPGPPAALHSLAEQARGALGVGRRLGRTGEVLSYRRLGVERLLLQVEPREHVGAYVDEWLGPLLAHQSEGRAAAPLVDTLDALAATGWNMRAAARRLNVHVNTLLYRLERARSVSGRDLDDPEVRLALGLALRARALVAASDDPHEWGEPDDGNDDPYRPEGAALYHPAHAGT